MKGAATVGVMLLMGLVAFAYLSLGSAQEVGCADQPTSYDLNGDGVVSSIDQMCLARHYGEEQWTPTPFSDTGTPTAVSTSTSTPTPSMTASSTATSSTSPTPAPPATVAPSPTPMPNAIAQILADSTGPHQGCLSDTISSYDWYTSARPGTYNGAPNLTPWYQIAWDHCAETLGGGDNLDDGLTVPNVYVRNFAGFKLTSAGWQTIGSGPDIGQWGNYPISFVGSCSGWSARQESDGLSFAPSADRACIAHGWTWPRGSASGMICALVRVDMRGDGPFLVNVGLDQYSGDTYRGDMGIGAFRRVTDSWRRVWMTSCTAAQLSAAGVP